jgi:hypothetical protein
MVKDDPDNFICPGCQTLQDRARESGITLPRLAPPLQGLQTAARRDGWRKYPEILPHKPA